MSVTTREVSYEVASKGGFPTAEEFAGVWKALVDVQEFGLDRLLDRIAAPLVEAYENDRRVEFTYADLGLLKAKADALVEAAEFALETARKLHEVAVDVGEVLDVNGLIDHAPTFSAHGTEYHPSPEALERWGLAKRKGGDDAS